MRDDRKWIGMTLGSFSNKTGYNERSLKSNGGQKTKYRFLKKLREEYDFSLYPLAQLLTATNRSLSWNK